MSLASTWPLRTDVPAANPYLRRVHEATAALAARGLRAAPPRAQGKQV